jgi:acetyl esterase/lipase
MSSNEAMHLAQSFGETRERLSRPGLELTTMREICESVHTAAREPEGVTYQEVDAGGVQALWCVPEDCDPEGVLLHLHAGGTVVFSMYSDRKVAGHIARATGARALVVDFRRAPEHKFPAQRDDVATVYRWVLAQGYRPEKVALVGHSIGANLAVELALGLRDAGVPLPGAILAVSGWYDPGLGGETMESNADTDRLLSRPILEFFRECWLGRTGVASDDPRVNVLRASLVGLPPMNIYFGAHELLASDSTELARKAKKAGLDISLTSMAEGQHSFIFAAGRVPEVDDAIRDMGRWLRAELHLANQVR